MSAIAEYKLISTDDGAPEQSPTKPDWRLYPADLRPQPLPAGTPKGSALLRTGGNALQAVNLDQVNTQNVMSVVAPEGKEPGDTILVACPHEPGRLISTVIPQEVWPGQVFLVRAPAAIPKLVTGVPVDAPTGNRTPLVHGYDIDAGHELSLQEQQPKGDGEWETLELGHTRVRTEADEEDFEMVVHNK